MSTEILGIIFSNSFAEGLAAFILVGGRLEDTDKWVSHVYVKRVQLSCVSS